MKLADKILESLNEESPENLNIYKKVGKQAQSIEKEADKMMKEIKKLKPKDDFLEEEGKKIQESASRITRFNIRK